MKNCTLLLLFYWVGLIPLNAQEVNDSIPFWSHSKEVGINVTPLISKLIPFNLRDSPNSNLIGLKTKWYHKKRAFIINFASDLSEQFDNSFFLTIGYEKRHRVYKKFTYTTGFDFGLYGDPDAIDFSGPFVLFSRPYGLEYHINEKIFISTEARFMIGLLVDDGIGLLKLRPPTSIFFNIRI